VIIPDSIAATMLNFTFKIHTTHAADGGRFAQRLLLDTGFHNALGLFPWEAALS
jgi:hypothetical protein